MVDVTESRVPLSHLLTRLLAIIGGVFSVLGVIDALFYRIQKIGSKNM
jgi:hypothetical protein